MTDSSSRKPLSRRRVVASYAVSVGGFLMICMISTGNTVDNPWYGLLAPGLVLYLCPMVLKLSGFLISLRRPERRDWFIRGHVCLVVSYVLCLLCALLSAVASGPSP